jgi:hypothetical protein
MSAGALDEMLGDPGLRAALVMKPARSECGESLLIPVRSLRM